MTFLFALIRTVLVPVLLVVLLLVIVSTGFVVRQQHVAIVERLGRFVGVRGPGFHLKVPVIDSAHDVSLMTEDQHMTFDAKTSDNVTIELDVSIQYHVDASNQAVGEGSGIWKSFYTLTDPVSQMKDYLADALRSQIPNRSLDEVFSEKDSIASAIDEVVAKKMLDYGYVLVTTLITSIRLPKEVQESMNRIVASKNNPRECAQRCRGRPREDRDCRAGQGRGHGGRGQGHRRPARGDCEGHPRVHRHHQGVGALERGGEPPLRVHAVGWHDGGLRRAWSLDRRAPLRLRREVELLGPAACL